MDKPTQSQSQSQKKYLLDECHYQTLRSRNLLRDNSKSRNLNELRDECCENYKQLNELQESQEKLDIDNRQNENKLSKIEKKEQVCFSPEDLKNLQRRFNEVVNCMDSLNEVIKRTEIVNAELLENMQEVLRKKTELENILNKNVLTEESLELEKLQKFFNQTEAELSTVRSQCVEKETEVHDLNGRLSFMRTETERLVGEREKISAELIAKENLNKEKVEALRQENFSRMKQIRDEAATRAQTDADVKAKLEEIIADNNKMAMEIQQRGYREKNLSQEIAQLENQIYNMKKQDQELDKLLDEQSISEVKESVANLNSALLDAKSENEKLTTQNKALSSKIESSIENDRQIQAEIENLVGQIDTDRKRSNELQQRIQESESFTKTLRRNNKYLKDVRDNNEETNKSLKRDVRRRKPLNVGFPPMSDESFGTRDSVQSRRLRRAAQNIPQFLSSGENPPANEHRGILLDLGDTEVSTSTINAEDLK